MKVNDQQRAAVARALLTVIQLDHLFTLEGPTLEALALRGSARLMPVRDRLILRLAFCIWNFDGGPGWGELLNELPASDLPTLVGVLIALSEQPGEVKRMLEAGDS